MKAIKIFTYNPKNQKSDFEFYALSKGLNSGKPLDVPCPNCFVISCRNAEEKDIYSSLLFGLWKSEAFHQFFVGSVIPFIRIADFKNFVFEQMLHLQEKQKAYQRTNKDQGIITHATTNLTADELEATYGNRLRSRMREMFNLFGYDGTSEDKRK